MDSSFDMIRSESEILRNNIQFIQGKDMAAWIPDNQRSHCRVCMKKFNAIARRKHHCRVCGDVVCSKCTEKRYINIPLAGTALTLACLFCSEHNKDDSQIIEGSAIHATVSASESIESKEQPPSVIADLSPETCEKSSIAHNQHEIKIVKQYQAVNNQLASPVKLDVSHIFVAVDSNPLLELMAGCHLACRTTSCSAGAIVLFAQRKFRVLAAVHISNTELNSRVFKTLCNHIRETKKDFRIERNREHESDPTSTIQSGFVFFCGSTILNERGDCIGCLVVLDKKHRPEFKKIRFDDALRNQSSMIGSLIQRGGVRADCADLKLIPLGQDEQIEDIHTNGIASVGGFLRSNRRSLKLVDIHEVMKSNNQTVSPPMHCQSHQWPQKPLQTVYARPDAPLYTQNQPANTPPIELMYMSLLSRVTQTQMQVFNQSNQNQFQLPAKDTKQYEGNGEDWLTKRHKSSKVLKVNI